MNELPVDGEGFGRERHDGPSLVALAEALLDVSDDEGATLRALGGVAVALRCPSARPPGPLARSYSDLDFVARRRDAPALTRSFERVGFVSAEPFNTVQAGARMRFDRCAGVHADIFLDAFRMCHVLSLAARLHVHDRTVSLADLLLTKLQVAKLNEKDVSDVTALFVDHPITEDDSGINISYICDLLSRDWGWWRTATETLSRLPSLAGDLALSAEAESAVVRQVSIVETRIEASKKRMRWIARARIGERRAWREDPEDVVG